MKGKRTVVTQSCVFSGFSLRSRPLCANEILLSKRICITMEDYVVRLNYLWGLRQLKFSPSIEEAQVFSFICDEKTMDVPSGSFSTKLRASLEGILTF